MKRLTKLEDCIGKTIKNVKILEKDDDYVLYEMLRIEFDDDTFIEIVAYDFEGYASEIKVVKK